MFYNKKRSIFAHSTKTKIILIMKKILLFIAALIFCGTTQAQEYHWTYDYHQWENACPMIAVVYLNGEVLASGNYEVAAFVGDEVRGTEYLLEVDPTFYPGVYFAWYGISFTDNNETVTFKLYDHATGTEYTNCSSTLLTNQNGYGEEDDPFIIEFTEETPSNYGPEYPWTVIGGFENYMYIEAQIQINGVPVTNTNWEVGAFCGDECRGLGDADNWWISPVDQSNILEIVVGGSTGDVINFYLYDVTNQEVFHGVCNETLDWEDDDIGDMFDPYVINFTTSAAPTIPLTITGWSEYEGEWEDDNNRGGYHLIATPVDGLNPTEVVNMVNNSYDLYTFDQMGDGEGNEWINCKPLTSDFKLSMGTGYLYATKETVTLEFTGEPMTDDYEVTLTKGESENWQGWNLVGNSFTQAINVERPFYKMNERGDGFVTSNNGGEVNAMEGFFVEASVDGEVMTFSLATGIKDKPALAVTLRSGNQDVDNAIVNFEQSLQLHKLQFRQGSSQIYITMDDQDYAVVNAESMGELPISFKAEKSGSYTLSFNAEGVSFSYLHLIDNMTGADVNLLNTSNYSFDASTSDYASRFLLVFSTSCSINGDNFSFVNGSGNLCIFGIEGEATLQVFDAMGRMLSSEQFSGSYEKQLNAAPGVYMLRLTNGNNVKVQKMVVR